MMISMSKDFNEIKSKINRQIDKCENHVALSLEFNENRNKGKNKFDLQYLKKLISAIKKAYPKIDFEFDITYVKHNNFFIDHSQCCKLEEINNYLIDNFHKELLIRKENEGFRTFTFQSVINANRQLDKISCKVNKIKQNNPNISIFEQFMILYEEVTDFIYKEEARYDQLNASHWISVVNGDSIVCTGYASLLKELASRLFDKKDVLIFENDVDVFDKSSDELLCAHANNIIFIKDDKYGINGLFYLDPCWDSIEKKDEIKAYSYCCIPLKDIKHNKLFDFYFRNVYQYILEEEYANFFGIHMPKRRLIHIPFIDNFTDDNYLDDKNSLHYYIKNYDSLNNKSLVPLEAYINSFKIIGLQKGLKDDALKSFVKERIEKSMAKTKYYFEVSKCQNVFAKEVIKSQSAKEKKMYQ